MLSILTNNIACDYYILIIHKLFFLFAVCTPKYDPLHTNSNYTNDDNDQSDLIINGTHLFNFFVDSNRFSAFYINEYNEALMNIICYMKALLIFIDKHNGEL